MKTPVILITGTHGFVGERAMEHFQDAIPIPGELVRHAGEPLVDFVKQHHPDIILNVAAISDIGTCEKYPEESYAANVTLPIVLAQTAAEIGAKLISFSSDQVYTGCTDDGPYRESDSLPPPINLYARHKLEAERRVLDITPNAVMLRATWMYDMPLYGHRNRGNFLVNTLQSVLRGKPLKASATEHRGITYVRQVVSLLSKVFDLPGGVYNYGSENPLTMAQTMQALREIWGIDGVCMPTEDKRHPLWMDTGRLRENGIAFDTTAEGFRRCAQDYGWPL